MKSLFIISLTLCIVKPCLQSQQQDYPKSISINITNQVQTDYPDLLIKLDIDRLQQQYPDFKPMAVKVFSEKTEIPCQVNDPDGDGKQDEIIFLSDFEAGEKKAFMLEYGIEKNKQEVFYPKRTQAEISHKSGGHWDNRKYNGGDFVNVTYLRVPAEHTDHSFFIRYEGPGWESDKVGYRFYLDWRNAIDIFGKFTDTLVLQHVGLDGFDSYHQPAKWGMDIFKVGKSLGLGSVAIWKNERVRMVNQTDSVTCRIALNGPVESMIETIYYGWTVDSVKNKLTSRLSICGGSRVTEHKLMLTGDGGILCTGLIKDKQAGLILQNPPVNGWTYLASWGSQSLNNDNLGIAVLFHSSNLVKITEDSINHIVVLKPVDNELNYHFLAAWEKEPGGIKTEAEFVAYLNSLTAILNNPLIVEFRE